LAFIANHANFSRANALVCADKTLIDTILRSLSKYVGLKIITWGAVPAFNPHFVSPDGWLAAFYQPALLLPAEPRLR
jgi:hypothetical protein